MAQAKIRPAAGNWNSSGANPDLAREVFTAARGLQTATWIYDIDNACVLHANRSALKFWQADSEEQLRDRDMSNDMSPTVAKRLKQYQSDFIHRDAVFHEQWTLYPNGDPECVMVRFFGFRLPSGRMALQCEVLSEAKDLPENVRSAEALLYTDVAITLFGLDGPPLYLNPAARNISHDADAPLSQWFVHRKDFDILMYDIDGHGEHRRVAEIKTASGLRWFDMSAKSCRDAVTGNSAILVTSFDVTELKIARDKARYLADRDQLTGCFNRAYLHNHLADIRAPETGQSALLYFDVDRFKQINDTLGHEVGDAVLIELAARTRAQTGPEDTVVRLGGDEFVVAIGDAECPEMFKDRVDALFASLCDPVRSGASLVDVSVSMGIAHFAPGRHVDVGGVLRRADTALYVSKKDGRGRFTFYNEDMGAAAALRARTEKEIEQALRNHEFILEYQPRIDVASGRIHSFEGLVRWQHPERGRIMPGEFISICEETGMIEELGQQVLEMGFAQAKSWTAQGLDASLSLNISPRQFASDDLTSFLKAFSRTPNFPKGKLELEITESMLFGDHDDIASKLQTISKHGYRIAIDDFGTGYSNLAYISRFPLNCLKVDRSFIMQLPESGPIIRLIIALAKQIGLKTVAEGVETQDQYDWLAAQGCDEIQGYMISRPLPVWDAELKLRQSTATAQTPP